ncbi:MAG: hypothetical protein Q8O00_12590 [Holophaga sp.]|nr:hypothetical protein [Holophaga sp.]
MRRIAFLGIALPVALLAADLFAQLGWEQAAFEDTCFQFVVEPERLPNFYVTPAMRALAVTQRKGAIEAIGTKAKAYYASEAFKKRWAEHRGQFTGSEDQERQRADAEAQGTQMLDQAVKQMEQMLPMMPPAQQAELKKAIAQAKAEKAKAGKEKKSGGDVDNAPPKDPRVNLRKALQHVLAVTDGVDYGATLSQQSGRRYFANKAFEAKPDAWKMAFRAGREASEGARGYVRTWLAELK